MTAPLSPPSPEEKMKPKQRRPVGRVVINGSASEVKLEPNPTRPDPSLRTLKSGVHRVHCDLRLFEILLQTLLPSICSSVIFNTRGSIFCHTSFCIFMKNPPAEMYDNLGAQPGVPRLPVNTQANPFGNAFSGGSSGFIRSGLGAYGEKILGSSSEYVQSNISRYFSDPQYYFQVNDQYVRNKLKVVLFPFLHRGHWTRITEPVGGRLSYKPPIFDINAPDLYIPFMAFGTYVVLAGLSLGLQGRFTSEALNWLFIKGLVGWFSEVSLLKMTLFSLGSGEAPLLDIVSYAGYAFTGLSIALFGTIVWSHSYYFLMPWTSLCTGIFLVKTMKRVLFAEVRTYDSSRHHYLLLFIALAQFPLLFWLGKISLNWFF